MIEFTKPLTEFLSSVLDYDPDTGNLIWKHRPTSHFKTNAAFKTWNKRFCGTVAGTEHREDGRPTSVIVACHIAGKKYLLKSHRIIFSIAVRPILEWEEIDHRNGNPFDNKWDNLRLASRAENVRNTGKKRRNGTFSNLPKGVIKHGSGYRAVIMADYKTYYLGTFKSPQAAGNAYKKAAAQLHGQFARI